MKKLYPFFALVMIIFGGLSFSEKSEAARLDANNNIITYGQGIPSSMVSGRLFNQFSAKSGTGYVDVTGITYFDRPRANSPVKIKWITVSYENTSNGTPYFSDFFIDKRVGRTSYLTIPKEHKMLKRGRNSFTVAPNSENAQSVQLYLHADMVGSSAGKGTRYQYITAFY